MPQLENIIDSYQCLTNSSIYPIRTEYATLAFEDLYPRPGDADYNDMVVNFKVEEFFNSDNELTAIDLEFVPIARGAGYDHKLMLNLDGSIQSSHNITTKTIPTFNGDATITATYKNTSNGHEHTVDYAKNEDIVIFSSTKETLTRFANVNKNSTYTTPKYISKISIELDDPSLNIRDQRSSPGTALYRPYLHVLNTRQDIDLYTSNSKDGMIDSNGYPFGLIVPYEWSWPLERANINQAYPYFIEYRNWLSKKSNQISNQALNWYLYPDFTYVYSYNN